MEDLKVVEIKNQVTPRELLIIYAKMENGGKLYDIDIEQIDEILRHNDVNSWTHVETDPIPRDGREYLTKNNLQGGVKQLISWNNIHNYFTSKGKYIFEMNAGTHWIEIPN